MSARSRLPVDLLRKKTELTAEERLLVRSHVASSMEILVAQSSLSSDVVLPSAVTTNAGTAPAIRAG